MSEIGDEVQLRDEVFLLHRGKARVEARTPDDGGFILRVPGAGTMHFNRSGCQGASSRREVYWHNPFVAEPPKDPVLWAAFTRMAGELFETLKRWRREGWGDAGPDGDS